MSDDDALRPVDLRFPRSLRLKSPWAIRQIFQEGVRRNGHGYALYGVRQSGDEERAGSRLGVVVSNRYGRGVHRNRLRRRLREAARLNRSAWPSNMDLVLRATDRAPAEMDFNDLVSDLARTLGRMTTKA